MKSLAQKTIQAAAYVEFSVMEPSCQQEAKPIRNRKCNSNLQTMNDSD
jgi:hypothetical protein